MHTAPTESIFGYCHFCIQSGFTCTQCRHSVSFQQVQRAWLAVASRSWLEACVPLSLQGKSPKQVMTPAVADPSKLGYLKLYKMMLDMVRLPNI